MPIARRCLPNERTRSASLAGRLQVNVNATFMLTQALLPLLLNRTPVHWSLPHQALDVRGVQLGRICSVEICHRRDDAGTGHEYQQRLRVNCINPGGTRTACGPVPSRPKIHRNLKPPLISAALPLADGR